MHCVYCNQPIPRTWFEHHCIPVTLVKGQWIDMYNSVGDLTQPVDHVAHWLCHIKSRNEPDASSPDERTVDS